MKRRNKIVLHNRLFFKVYLSYACILTISAVLIGTLFMMVYRETSMNSYINQLKHEAENVSNKLSEFIKSEDRQGILGYISIFREINDERDIWIVANDQAENPIDSSMITMTYQEFESQKQYVRLFQSIVYGKSYDEATFEDAIHDDLRNAVAVPIRGMNGEVSGVLIYSSAAESQAQVVNNSIRLIVQCIFAALVISIIVANIFVRSITNPILKMSNTAVELAKGDYAARTDVRRKDEIGQLADTVDVLAERLLENEQERKNMEQMRMDFFANVSHELRTPITVIRAYVETLYDKVVTEEEKVEQYYIRILHECKSMQRLVGDLLLLSKMQNPDFEVDAEPVNIIQVFEDIIRGANAISQERNIKITMDTETDCCLMLGDYDRLRQMFMVILDNAIKFSNENSSIEIIIRVRDKIEIIIRDHGVGISKEELPFIFDKFYKSKLRQNAKGTGLGLAIARQIALKHNGTIEVESQLGQGTQFHFKFDYVTEEQLEVM